MNQKINDLLEGTKPNLWLAQRQALTRTLIRLFGQERDKVGQTIKEAIRSVADYVKEKHDAL